MRSIRVFTSSAFLDMHAERDYLNRVVFPELRSRCWKRGVEFAGIDLRWGLTEEDTIQRGALAACFQEIDRCRPFFISLIGDRYGWIPPIETIDRDLFKKARKNPALVKLLDTAYQFDETSDPAVYRLRRYLKLSSKEEKQLIDCWRSLAVPHAEESITEQEICHGTFCESEVNSKAFFYLRKPGIADHADFPQALTPIFVEQDSTKLEQLKQLKQRIRQTAGITVKDYEAQFAGWRIEPTLLPDTLPREDLLLLRDQLKDGVLQPNEFKLLSRLAQKAIETQGTIALTGMEQLGQTIIDDLWHGIETFLSSEKLPAYHTTDRAYHDRFLADRTRLFFGRNELLDRMALYVENDQERLPLVITGPAGCGKSALLAKFATSKTDQDVLVLPYFIGAAPGSTDLTSAVRSICETLINECEVDEEMSSDPATLQRQLPVILAKAGRNRKVVLLIDALNQLNPSDRSHELNWVPFYVPHGARVILSTLEGDCLDAIKRRVPANSIIEVPMLPRDDRRDLVCEQLARRAKKLTEEQLTGLLDVAKRPDAALPLYLLVAIEELCLFGARDALDKRLHQLPPTLAKLFEQVLERLEHDHTYEVTSAVLRWLAVSRSGLMESEINGLLSKNKHKVSPAHWIRFYRALEPYLRPMDEASGAGFIDFYHDQLRFAAYRRYFDMNSVDDHLSSTAVAAHQELADYFRDLAHGDDRSDSWSTDYPHAINELPFHLIRSGQSDEARKLLLEFEWMQTKLTALDSTALLMDYELAQSDADLDVLKRSLLRAAPVIAREKRELAGQLLGRLLTYESPDIQRMLDHAANWRSEGVWLRPIAASLAGPDEPLKKGLLAISSVAVTSDLSKAVSCSDEGVIRVWDVQRDTELKSMGSNMHRLSANTMTPEGDLVVTSSEDHLVRLWTPLEDNSELASLPGHTSYITAIALTPDRKWAISVAEDQTLRLWDIEKQIEVPRFPGISLIANKLAISPDGRRVAAASPDGSLRIWEDGRELPSTIRHSSMLYALAFAPDGRRIVAASDKTLRVWDVEQNKEIHQLVGHTALVRVALVTPDGRYCVSGSDDILLRIWDLEDGGEVGVLEAHWWAITAANITPDGKHVVSASGDETLKVWDLADRKELYSIRGVSHWVNCLCVTPDGQFAVSVSRDKALRVWDVATGKPVRDLTGHNDWVNAVAVTSNGVNLISGSEDRVLKVWDFASGEELFTLTGHGNGISGVAFTPDGKLAVSGCWDHTLKVWRLETKSELYALDGHPTPDDSGWVRAVAMLPDGERVVSASHDHTLKIWDLSSRRELTTLRGHDGWVMCVAALADGKRIISGSADGTLKLWDLETESVLRTFTGHTGFVTGVAVTSDGLRAVSTSEDQTLKLWDLAEGTVIASFTGDSQLRACAVTPDNRTIIAGESSGRMHFLRVMVQS